MNQIIEVNIADVLLRLETKIDNLDDKIDRVEERLNTKIDNLANQVNEVKINVAKLDEKIIGVDKRLGNLEFVARSIAGGVIIALLLAFARYLFPNVTL
jgi:chromosome segregation ATPase